TWTFPGWEGIVYPTAVTKEELLERGLGWAARHPLFRTVGIDRSYYAPLDEAELRRYAAELPAGFRCVMKAWSAVTTLADPPPGACVPRSPRAARAPARAHRRARPAASRGLRGRPRPLLRRAPHRARLRR